MSSKKIMNSTIIAYILLNYKSFTRFNRLQLIIGCISFITAVLSYINRNCYYPSYKYYTSLWHTCNSILLCFCTSTLKLN